VAEQRVQRRLAANLAAEVVGYSRLMAMDGHTSSARLACFFHCYIEGFSF
jgi:hypothetical protein